MSETLMNINYLQFPEHWSNCAIIDSSLIEPVGALIEGTERLSPDNFALLATLIETVVLSERIVFCDEGPLPADHYQGGNFSASHLADLLVKNKVANTDNDEPYDWLSIEYAHVGDPYANTKVSIVHGDHLVIDRSDRKKLQDTSDDEVVRAHQLARVYDKSFLSALNELGGGVDLNDGLPDASLIVHLIANCHGVPFVSSSTSSVRDICLDSPTNIGFKLYSKLEEQHSSYFRSIRSFLGPTYIRIPSLVALVLREARKRDYIPQAMLKVRERFSDLRRHCTKLEIDLRTAPTLREQVRIIQEIDECCSAVASHSELSKTRVINRLYDIVKQIDPVKMLTKGVDFLNEYDVHRESLLKIPGYYDLWNASVDVEQSFNILTKIFPDEVTATFVGGIEQLARGENPIDASK